MSNTVLITGNTYPVKDALRALGGRWNATAKGWDVPADKAAEARVLVTSATPQPRTYTPATGGTHRRGPFVPCGYPGCSPGYCDECDGRGKYSRY